MAKKCIICSDPAVYKIKDTSDYYCEDCAEENFADISILVKVEDEAKRLKVFVDSQIDGVISEDDQNEEEIEEEIEEEEETPKKKSKKK